MMITLTAMADIGHALFWNFFYFNGISLLQPAKPALYIAPRLVSGRSSGVEHNLAKVRVVSSNLITRSIFQTVRTNVNTRLTA